VLNFQNKGVNQIFKIMLFSHIFKIMLFIHHSNHILCRFGNYPIGWYKRSNHRPAWIVQSDRWVCLFKCSSSRFDQFSTFFTNASNNNTVLFGSPCKWPSTRLYGTWELKYIFFLLRVKFLLFFARSLALLLLRYLFRHIVFK